MGQRRKLLHLNPVPVIRNLERLEYKAVGGGGSRSRLLSSGSGAYVAGGEACDSPELPTTFPWQPASSPIEGVVRLPAAKTSHRAVCF